jgi:hypothetical protein
MKLYVLLASLLLVTSCGGKPLTSAECTTLRDKEIAHISSLLPVDAPTLQKALNDNAERGLAKCAAGDGYNRGDYNCIMAAHDQMEIGQCMTEARKHIKL